MRQPRRILGLVLGPFLIMVLFGLGYRGPRPQLRTILEYSQQVLDITDELEANLQSRNAACNSRRLNQTADRLARDFEFRRSATTGGAGG